MENGKYQFYKKNYIVSKIHKSGLPDFIHKKTLSSSIILFGSAAKGTLTEKSDIDIFIESKETDINISQFGSELSKKINLLFEQNINNLSTELKNNILNGIILKGFVKIKG